MGRLWTIRREHRYRDGLVCSLAGLALRLRLWPPDGRPPDVGAVRLCSGPLSGWWVVSESAPLPDCLDGRRRWVV